MRTFGKSFRAYVTIFLTLAIFESCHTEKYDDSEIAGVYLSVDVSAYLPETRTIITDDSLVSSFRFTQKDSIGFFASNIVSNLWLKCTYPERGYFWGQAELTQEQTNYIPSIYYYSYYPYCSNAGSDPSSLSSSLPAVQSAPFDGDADYMVAEPIEDVYDINCFPSLTFTFSNHLFSIVKLSITNTSDELEGERIVDIGLKSSGPALAGAFTFDATDPSRNAIFSTAEEDLFYRVKVAYDEETSPILGNGETHVVYAVVKPDIFRAGELRLIVTTTNYSFSLATKTDVSLMKDKVTVFPEVDLSDPCNKGVVKKTNTMDMLSFSLSADGLNYYDAFDIVDGIISVQVPNGTEMKNMIAKFTHNGQSVQVNGIEQTSGVDQHDYSDFVNPLTFTVNGAEDDFRTYTIRMFDLPIVFLETSSPITSKEIWVPDCSISIREADGSITDYGNKVEVKGRGNSTWRQEKKPYTIKLPSKASVFGLPADKRWNLLANALDRTIIRNAVSLEIAHRADNLGWSSHGFFVELILNGEYKGNYFICEHNKIAKDRVNITEMKVGDISEDAITGGYLLEFDTTKERPYFITETCEYPVNIKSPDDDGFDLQWAWIEGFMNELERILADEELLATHKYLDYIDIDSFIDWWLVYEVIMNTEPYYGPRSAFMHKVRGGKLKAGPAWDFDRGFRSALGPRGFKLKDALYYKYLFKDPLFVAKIKERWPVFKANLDGMSDFIDAQIALVSHSAERNGVMWPITLNINTDESLPVLEACARVKSEYQARIIALDGLISALEATPTDSSTGNENFNGQTTPDFGFGF